MLLADPYCSPMWKATEPFNELPPPPPAEKLETHSVLKRTTEARAALASLNQALKSIPNPGVLVSTLPLLEAQASSEIENIFTTTDDLFRYASDVNESPSTGTKETLRYRSALYRGTELVRHRPISTSIALEVCTELRGVESRIRDLPGTYIGNPSTGEVRYTPPDGQSLIARMLGDWESFIHTPTVLDPLVVMAVAHYQFEAIHPFSDGNGRTGRVLNVLQLLEANLLQEPVLYLSRYIIQNKSEYYQRLLNVTSNQAWEAWILFMLSAVEETSVSTLTSINKITEAQSEFRETMREVMPGGANADLLDTLFEQPYCRISNIIDRCQVSRPTATRWLRELASAHLLEEVKVGRERLFINKRMISILR